MGTQGVEARHDSVIGFESRRREVGCSYIYTFIYMYVRVCVCIYPEGDGGEGSTPDGGWGHAEPCANSGEQGPRRSRRCPRRVPAVPVPGAGAGAGRAVSLPAAQRGAAGWSPGSHLTPSLPG